MHVPHVSRLFLRGIDVYLGNTAGLCAPWSQVAIADCLDLDDLTELPLTSSLRDNEQQQQDIANCGHRLNTAGSVFTYPCRCGAQYTLHEADLSDAADSIVVGCDGCSLHVRVTYSVSADSATPRKLTSDAAEAAIYQGPVQLSSVSPDTLS